MKEVNANVRCKPTMHVEIVRLIRFEALRFYWLVGRARADRQFTGCTMPRCWSLAFIKQASFGFSLEEIKQIIDDKRAGHLVLEVRELVRLRKNSMNACNRCSAIAKLALAEWGRDGRSTRAYLRLD